MDGIHKILSGNPDNRPRLILASLFVLVWFAMDAIEFGDWVSSKIHTATVACKLDLEYIPYFLPMPQTHTEMFVPPYNGDI